MASISSPTFPSPSSSSRSNPSALKFSVTNPKLPPHLKRSSPSPTFSSHSLWASHSISRTPDITFCRCYSSNNGNNSDNSHSPSPSEDSSSGHWRLDAAISEAFTNAIKRFSNFLNSRRDQSKFPDGEREATDYNDDDEWDWDRWKKQFNEVDDQERIVFILKSQLARAIYSEDYEEAARLKVAIAAAATNDTVGRVMSHLHKAIEEEQYQDAALLCDYAGAGLVGWWAGISEDNNDPYGRIIRISAEHGRYVARNYSPRQLATATIGAPLFEIFLTMNRKGKYRQQAVYLKRKELSQGFPITPSKTLRRTSSMDSRDSTEDRSDLFVNTDDAEDNEDIDDDSDTAEGLSSFENILRDMVPGVKVKVLKVTTPGKFDKDMISKVIDQIMDEEDEEKDNELESADVEDEVKDESDGEQNEIEMNPTSEISDSDEHSQIAVKVVVGGLVQRTSSNRFNRDLLRVPARLEKKGRSSFSFSIEKDETQYVSGGNGQSTANKAEKVQAQRSMDHIMLDLAKSIGSGKIPMRLLKDVGELITLTLSQAQNRQPLSGSTTFNRIEIPASPDPLNGLYIGAHGLYTSEVIHLRRKFGQWQDEGSKKEPRNLEFYEYVEAVKLTGDPYVPAGQVAFRAKVGKRYQLPHKGIIPEEFGVIARYRGQGRLAEPGFQKPRWVDGELVILDGKYIKGGPVVGFVYWAPEYHFLVFFNRLRLQE